MMTNFFFYLIEMTEAHRTTVEGNLRNIEVSFQRTFLKTYIIVTEVVN